MKLNCPLPAALTTIPLSECPFRFDQIVRLFFQMRVTESEFAAEADMQVLANWTPLLTALDNTKIIVSPIFAGFVIPKSEPNVQGGGDNSTFAGIEQYYGENPVRATGTFQNLTGATLAALREISQFSLSNAVGATNLTVYMVNKDGYVFYKGDQLGIPVYNFRVGTTGSEGLNRPNANDFSFNLPEGWDEDIQVVKPAFDPLTAL